MYISQFAVLSLITLIVNKLFFWFISCFFFIGTCYAKVREETKAMKESMNQDDYYYNAPRSEVAYVYKVSLLHIYRPQTKFGAREYFQKRVSRILSGGEVPGQVPPPHQVHPPRPGTPPRDQVHPPPGAVLGDTGNKRAVRILLECILVIKYFLSRRRRQEKNLSGTQ